MTYQTGHVKHNADLNQVAIRTHFPEDVLPDSAWLVSTVNKGPLMCATDKVADWDDLYTPPTE